MNYKAEIARLHYHLQRVADPRDRRALAEQITRMEYEATVRA